MSLKISGLWFVSNWWEITFSYVEGVFWDAEGERDDAESDVHQINHIPFTLQPQSHFQAPRGFVQNQLRNLVYCVWNWNEPCTHS